MDNKIYILLAAVIMIALPLFGAWLPFIGQFIPKLLVFVYVIFFAPHLMRNKAFNCLLFFYLYVILQSLVLGYGFFFVTWFANFMDYALPIFLLQAAIYYDNEKTISGIASFSIIYIVVTIVLSIIVMIDNPDAMRSHMATEIESDIALAHQYSLHGLSSYGFAAMIMCFPAVLLSIYKSTSDKRIKLISLIVVLLCFIFMWMGQVTTTLIICVSLAFISLFLRENTSNSIYVGAAIFILFVGIFGGTIIDAILPYTEGTAMEAKFTNFSSQSHTGQIETGEGSLEGRMSLTALSLEVFSEHPIFGDSQGYIGGHNFFIDRFALYGIIGVIPFFLMLYYLYESAVRYLPQNKRGIYKLIFLGFLSLGILKNMAGIDYWLFIFCFYPFILKFSNRFNKKYSRTAARN